MNTLLSARIPRMMTVLALLVVLGACDGVVEEERYREIGPVFLEQDGSFAPIVADVGQHRIHVRFEFGGGCCDSRSEVETEVDGRAVRITPYFSDQVNCGPDCQRVHVHDDTISFSAGGEVDVRIVGEDGSSLVVDTTVSIN